MPINQGKEKKLQKFKQLRFVAVFDNLFFKHNFNYKMNNFSVFKNSSKTNSRVLVLTVLDSLLFEIT